MMEPPTNVSVSDRPSDSDHNDPAASRTLLASATAPVRLNQTPSPKSPAIKSTSEISKIDLNDSLASSSSVASSAIPSSSGSLALALAEHQQKLSMESQAQPAQPPAQSQGHNVKRRGRRNSSRSHSRSSSRGLRSSDMVDAKHIPYSAPAQVYRNLLIMEESFRQQYAAMTVSRRNHVVFFVALLMVTAYYTYAVFVVPSLYKLVIFIDRLMFMGSVITLGLFYLTGLYTKTFVYGPKFFYSMNKGLRPYNMKLVKVRKTWSESIIGLLWNPSYQAAPGRLVKLVLSTRAFSTDTIHAWDLYRQDYWDREAERLQRIKQRTKLKKKDTSKRSTGTSVGAGGEREGVKSSVHGHHSTRLQHLTPSLPSTPSLVPSA